MDNPDDWLNPPPDDAVLWRYMDFAKFVSILAKKSLFFTRADKLGDLFEGYWPLLDSYSSIASGYKAVIPLALINCWHESPHESEAMWRLYSRETDGIAIKTNFGSLRTCLKSHLIRFGIK